MRYRPLLNNNIIVNVGVELPDAVRGVPGDL
jgi:hypothetical protein